ncbi:MAG TPA: Yip1 family protein [Bacillota bacterium]|nr:Yip1 family protein [Bacillota bacterium]
MRQGFAEMVVGILARPRETLRQVGDGGSLGPALIVLAMVAAITGWSSALASPHIAARVGGPAPLALMAIMGGGVLLLVQAGIGYGLARLLGSRGSFLGLLSGLALANVPSVFQAPFALLAVTLGPAGTALSALGTAALSVWVIVLSVLALRETFVTSTGRAVLIYFLYLILVLFLAGALAVLAMVAGMLLPALF